MAMKKVVNTDFGIQVPYWRIVGLHINLADGSPRALAEVAGYTSAEARKNGAAPIPGTMRQISLSFEDAKSFDTALAACYAKLSAEPDEKSLEPPFFGGATKV